MKILSKAEWVFTLSMLGFFVFGMVCAGVGAVAYILLQPTPAPLMPEFQHDVKVVTVEVPSTPIVVEKVITATPQAEVLAQVVPTISMTVQQPALVPTPPFKSCINDAYIEMQTKDKIQGDALKIGTIYRFNTTLHNAGTCDWDNYKLVSVAGDMLEADVPFTPAGQSVNFIVTEGKVYKPLHYMMVMQDDIGNQFRFSLGGTIYGCMEWKMDVYNQNTIGQLQLYGYGVGLSCGAGG